MMSRKEIEENCPSLYQVCTLQVCTFTLLCCNKINVHNPFGQTSAHQLCMHIKKQKYLQDGSLTGIP